MIARLRYNQAALGLLLGCALFSIVGVQTANADTTYVYTGNPFDEFSGADSCSMGAGECSLSGSFTVAAPLGDNLAFGSITPISFSFTDGVNTITSADTLTLDILEIETNASGQIVGWYFHFNVNVPGNSTFELTSDTDPPLSTEGDLSGVESNVSPFAFSAIADNFDDAGSWSVAGTSPIPEPSSLALFGTGLACIVGLRRKIHKNR
jgi:hypothetical protein